MNRQAAAGQLRALVIASKARSPLIPEVPTTAEGGYGDVVGSAWNGIVAPAGTSRDIVARLNTEVLNAIADTEVRRKLEDLGFTVRGTSAKELDVLTRDQLAKYARVIKDTGIPQE